ncbi:hypothetical protein ABZ942_10045 [Nocardia sp. NPDC046473]|uniref:LGFP repeat-containing protein n=1 Tax=Nocardia sp. NPDC046473 TaxID=3155733 RepID=UPI0033F77FEB
MSLFRSAKVVFAAVIAANVVAAAASTSAHPIAQQDTGCRVPVYGAIGSKWQALRAQYGPLGCPTSPEGGRDNGRAQSFDHGEIVWSADQGPVANWAVDHTIYSDWGPTHPYRFFIVHWDDLRGHVDQRDITPDPGGTTGRAQTPHPFGDGKYEVRVEGCDKDLGGAACHGWSVRSWVRIPQAGTTPPPAPPPHIAVQPDGGGAFTVSGGEFLPSAAVHARAVYDNGLDPNLPERRFEISADRDGNFRFPTGPICHGARTVHFSASDGRSNPNDLTGWLWSNTVHEPC